MMNTSIANQINRFARTNENHLIELLTAICSLPSPTGSEQAKANWILAYLHKLGASEAYIDSAGNVIWPCQIAKGTKHPVYGAHIDTVFNQVTSIKPKITGNVFAAPSCGDNSANVASLLFFAEMILSLHMDLPAGAFFLFNVGEEGLGNLRGIRQFMTDHAHEVSEMVAVDCNSDSFINLAVGSHRYQIDVQAEGGHSWGNFGNDNAIAIASGIIWNLYNLDVPASPKTTYNVGTIQGGSTVNSIAEHASFTIDLRSESKEELQRVDQKFHELLDAARDPKIQITETFLGERPCNDGAENSDMCRRLTRIRSAHGLTTTFQSASTDANIPLSLGIPAISFGTCIGRRAHSVYENLDLDSLVPGFIQLAEFILTSPACQKE